MIPPALAANPSLDRWVRFEPDGAVVVAFGKTENGQGVMTALAQIAADELDVAFERVRWPEPVTGAIPDEGRTVGSMSIETSGAALRAVCAEVRALALAASAERLGCDPAELDVRDGAVFCGGKPTGDDYWSLGLDLARAPTGEAPWKPVDQLRITGANAPRVDLAPKLFGAAFLHDLVLPGLRHARVLRRPPDATFAGLDEDAVRRGVPDVDILIDHEFVAVIAATEADAARAYDAAAAAIRWDGAADVSPRYAEPEALKDLPAETFRAGAPVAEPANRRRHTAAYGRPFISHGSIGPSVGVAELKDGRLKLWAHNQGVYPLADMAMRVTGLPLDAIEVRHASGAGNYGHNGSDDAAIDAAVIAVRRPGVPIRVQWRREDEFGWSPVGAAMRIELSGELDAAGRLVDFTAEIWNPPHTNRGVSLAGEALPKIENLPPPRPQGPALPPGMRFSGGLLNAVPSYDIAATRTVEHVVKPPVRTSSLRGLGGPPNIYAGECFVDELAEIAGEDPLAYRLAMLTDPRGRAVLEKAAAMCDWPRRWKAGTGRGLGLAYDRHRDRGAYCAVAAEVEVEKDVGLVRLWCACDGGLIVNPDGAKNQLEGGMVMAASWALKEQVKLGGVGIASITWDDYPILTFSEVPPIEVELLNTRDKRPYGLGEISQGGTMAAIANAVAHALGARIRDLPLTRDKIAAALLAS